MKVPRCLRLRYQHGSLLIRCFDAKARKIAVRAISHIVCPALAELEPRPKLLERRSSAVVERR